MISQRQRNLRSAKINYASLIIEKQQTQTDGVFTIGAGAGRETQVGSQRERLERIVQHLFPLVAVNGTDPVAAFKSPGQGWIERERCRIELGEMFVLRGGEVVQREYKRGEKEKFLHACGYRLLVIVESGSLTLSETTTTTIAAAKVTINVLNATALAASEDLTRQQLNRYISEKNILLRLGFSQYGQGSTITARGYQEVILDSIPGFGLANAIL